MVSGMVDWNAFQPALDGRHREIVDGFLSFLRVDSSRRWRRRTAPR